MTALAAPERLASVLAGIADQLGDARFIGRHATLVDTDQHDGSRWYTDPDDPEVHYQSVTWTIGSSQSAPWLMAWAAKLAVEFSVDHWSEIGGLMRAETPDRVVAFLKAEAERQRELAAECGTWFHDVLEAILLDAVIPDPPSWILGRRLTTGGEDMVITQTVLDQWADGIVNFITDYRLVPVMAEASVCNPIEGYATRVDLCAEFPGYGLGLIDLKSGSARPSVMAQLTAMMHATEVWLPLGGKVPMPRCQWGAVLLLRQTWDRGYKLRRVPTGPEQWAWFQACTRLLKARESQPELSRMAMYPPHFGVDGSVQGIPALPMIEDTGWRCAKALRTAGLSWVAELAQFTAADVQAIKGVGPKSIDTIRAVLTGHRMAFADEIEEVA